MHAGAGREAKGTKHRRVNSELCRVTRVMSVPARHRGVCGCVRVTVVCTVVCAHTLGAAYSGMTLELALYSGNSGEQQQQNTLCTFEFRAEVLSTYARP